MKTVLKPNRTLSGKYTAYPEYKDSGVDWLGDIPSHWRVAGFKKYIKSIVDYRGKTPNKTDDGVLLVTARNIKKGSLDYSLSQEFIAEESYDDVMSRGKPSIGDILFTTEAPLGEVSNVDRTDIALAQRVIKFCGKEGVLDNYYFKYLIMSEDFQQSLYLFASGSTVKGIKAERFVYLRKLLPSIEEQEKIASFLNHETAKIDTLIEKQQQLIKLLKEKRQAVISHAVTKGLNPKAPMRDSGVKWLGQVPIHWEIRSVSKLSQKITNGYVGPTRDILVSKGVPYVQATHIKKGKVNFDDAYFVRQPWSDAHAKSILVKGDVLLVQTGAGTGDVGLVTENEAGFNCHALIIVQPIISVISGDFLSMVFQSQYGYSVLYSIRTGGMHPHLNCGEVQFVRIPIPPKEEQNIINKYINEKLHIFDTLINKQLLAIELMQERRTALISAAVTGKIDVRNWIMPTPSSTNGATND